MTISSEEEKHRKEFLNFVRTMAEPWHKEKLGILYDCWENWNIRYFDGKMVPPYMLLTDMQGARVMGDCSNISGFGGKSQIRLRRTILTGEFGTMKKGSRDQLGCFNVLEDTLLHEMIHQYMHEVECNFEDKFKGHGPLFRDHCNRIAEDLGFLLVRCTNQKSKEEIDKPLCAYWPHREDADEYYKGAFPSRVKFGERKKRNVEQLESEEEANQETLDETKQAIGEEEIPIEPEKVTSDHYKHLLEEGEENLSKESFILLKQLVSAQSAL